MDDCYIPIIYELNMKKIKFFSTSETQMFPSIITIVNFQMSQFVKKLAITNTKCSIDNNLINLIHNITMTQKRLQSELKDFT